MIDKFSNLKALLFGAELDKVRFEKNSYYFFLQKVNLDYMMGLDKDRLLYNYRRIGYERGAKLRRLDFREKRWIWSV